MVIRTLASVSMLLAAGSVASAEDDIRTAVVTFRAHELTDPGARAELQTRLDRAVDVVCRVPGRRDLASYRTRSRCRAETMTRIHNQLDQRLAALETGDRSNRQVALHVSVD